MARRTVHKIPDGYSRRIGALVRAERESRGLSLRDLATVAGLTHANLGRLERGEIASPPFDVICNLASVLDLEVDEFIQAASSSNRLRAPRRHRALADVMIDQDPLTREEVAAVRSFLTALRARGR